MENEAAISKAIACMTERGCYAVPVGNELPPQMWRVRNVKGNDLPHECYSGRPRPEGILGESFSDPVEALAWVYDWLHRS